MLLDVADVEFRLRTIYARLLDKKDEKWDAARAQAIDAVKELADFFSGSKVRRGSGGGQEWVRRRSRGGREGVRRGHEGDNSGSR
jgi:hypothetical protein